MQCKTTGLSTKFYLNVCAVEWNTKSKKASKAGFRNLCVRDSD